MKKCATVEPAYTLVAMPIDMPRRMSFDRDALAYHRGRPEYPSRVYELLSEHFGLTSGMHVLEIGAGSGIATTKLLACGATVTAIEPGAHLAAVLRERHRDDALTIVESELESAMLPTGLFDLAVAATSWHWIDAAIALSRLAAALRPEGGLAIWWTVFGPTDEPQTEFRTRLDALCAQYMPSERDDGSLPKPMRINEWTEQLQHGGWFAAPEVEQIRWTQHLTHESAQALWETFPNVTELGEQDRCGFLDGISAAIDSLGGTVDDPRTTIVYYTRRVASE